MLTQLRSIMDLFCHFFMSGVLEITHRVNDIIPLYALYTS